MLLFQLANERLTWIMLKLNSCPSFEHMKRALLASFLITAAISKVGAEPLKPKSLQPGDTVMMVTPARGVTQETIEVAQQRLEKLGLKVLWHPNLLKQNGYLAGSDQQRAQQINDAFANPDVQAVLPVTGGFGTTRLLDLLDYETIQKNPKVLIGFSDITGLHLAIQRKTGMVTFHGPNLDSGSGSPKKLNTFSEHWWNRALMPKKINNGYLITWNGTPGVTETQYANLCKLDAPETITGGKATGRITGGNLSLITALMGTPYEVDTDETILYIEDIGEAAYRVDRMLSTLRLAGKLDTLRGVVLGTFTYRADQDTSIKEGQTVDQVLRSYFGSLGIPVVNRFPAGHHACNATLPLNVKAELDADAGTIRLLESPVRQR